MRNVSKDILQGLREFTKDLESGEKLSNKHRLCKMIRREDGDIEVTESYQGNITKKVIRGQKMITQDPVVKDAKHKLMATLRLSENVAYVIIRNAAMNQRATKAIIAREILNTDDLAFYLRYLPKKKEGE